jgi:hypothetical protein
MEHTPANYLNWMETCISLLQTLEIVTGNATMHHRRFGGTLPPISLLFSALRLKTTEVDHVPQSHQYKSKRDSFILQGRYLLLGLQMESSLSIIVGIISLSAKKETSDWGKIAPSTQEYTDCRFQKISVASQYSALINYGL